MARRPAPPSPPAPFGGIPANHSGQGNHPPTRVVVHSAVTPCTRGMARRLAQMNRDGSTGGSWHYATDPGEAIQCSWDRYVCWHAPPNGGSLGVEMADTPGPRPKGRTRQALWNLRKVWRWRGKDHQALLEVTADLVGDLVAAYGLPPVFLSPSDLRKGRRGWTTHANVSRAFGQSTHWDPGWWPRRKFGRLVRRRHARRTSPPSGRK